MRRGFAEDIDRDRRRHVPIESDREHAAVEIRTRMNFESVAREHRVRQDGDVVAERAHFRRAPTDLFDRADVVAGTNDVADFERILEMQRDAGEEIAEGFLKSESENRGEDRAAGENGPDVVVEDRRKRGDEENEIERDGDDVAQQRRRRNSAAFRHEEIEHERVDRANDEDDDRRDCEKVQKLKFRSEDRPEISRNEPRLARENEVNPVERDAEDQRKREPISVARSHLLTSSGRAPLARKSNDVADADDQMHDAESGDEAAHEWIVDPHRHGDRLMKKRIHAPDARPRNDGEEDPCLEAIEGKEKRDGHSARAL